MRKILEELKNQIKNEIGIMPVFAPQQASGNTAMIILSYTGIEAAGERPDDARNTANESITLSAVFSISGTHEKWLNTAILYSRNFIRLIENGGKMPLTVYSGEQKKNHIYAQWERIGKGQFLYDEDKSMPVTYQETYSVTIVYPASMIGGEN